MTLKQLLKPVIPTSIVTKLQQARDKSILKEKLKYVPRRIVIGSSGVFQAGWVPTNAQQLNLVRRDTWTEYFTPDSIDAMLAEHVWEHLTLEEAKTAAATCYHFLKPGGYIRLAVPDGLFPDPEYQEYIKVGGEGGGGEIPGGHMVVYTYGLLREVFESAGFKTRLLEYSDESGGFHFEEWDPADGMIHRSKRFDERGPISIILDATK
jgi:predicted SAM-dependent methyltransferase